MSDSALIAAFSEEKQKLKAEITSLRAQLEAVTFQRDDWKAGHAGEIELRKKAERERDEALELVAEFHSYREKMGPALKAMTAERDEALACAKEGKCVYVGQVMTLTANLVEAHARLRRGYLAMMKEPGLPDRTLLETVQEAAAIIEKVISPARPGPEAFPDASGVQAEAVRFAKGAAKPKAKEEGNV